MSTSPTVNPNMPLRDLFYVSKVLQGLTKDIDLYSRTLMKIPAPRFVVFYNGTGHQVQRQTLRLSDAFEKKLKKPELELLVTVFNINRGQNPELMESCNLLREYAEYVERVRNYAKEIPFTEAVERTVDECIREGILAEFLTKNRAEAVEMSIFEYDEEKHLKNEREWGYKMGQEDGEKRGENRRARQDALRMLGTGKLSLEEIAQCAGLPLETVQRLADELQPTDLATTPPSRK